MISASGLGTEEARLRSLLQLVADHPWAGTGFLQARSGWTPRETARAIGEATERGLVELARVPGVVRRPQMRLGLTWAGADVAGRRLAVEQAQLNLLGVLRLDPARLILAKLQFCDPILWSFSPHTVPLKSLLPVYEGPKKTRPRPKRKLPRLEAVRLEALAAVQVRADNPPAFANVAIMIDPGGVAPEAFERPLHSFLTWRSRPEFRAADGLAPENAFPVLIFVAGNADRQADFAALWRKTLQTSYSRYDGGGPFLRTLTRSELIEWDHRRVPITEWRWGTERSQSTLLWNGVALARFPSLRPLWPDAPWWGNRALSVEEAMRIVGLDYASKGYTSRRGILPRSQDLEEPPSATCDAADRGKFLKALVKYFLLLSGMSRWLLDRVGLYPLIAARDLALVLGLRSDHLGADLQPLLDRGLIEQPPEVDGFGLTWRGLALLAYQARYEPEAYAGLRGWALGTDQDGHPRLSLDAWLERLPHTRTTLAFLAGLRRHGAAAGLALTEWDHTQWPEASPDDAGRLRRLTPDARGVVRPLDAVGAAGYETAFWVEVDRSTGRGKRLMDKLARYYMIGGPRAGVSGRAERLLVVVDAGDEGRLRALQKRFRSLDNHFGTRLDVLLTRLDQMDDGRGGLDPTRAVWRNARDNDLRAAFI